MELGAYRVPHQHKQTGLVRAGSPSRTLVQSKITTFRAVSRLGRNPKDRVCSLAFDPLESWVRHGLHLTNAHES